MPRAPWWHFDYAAESDATLDELQRMLPPDWTLRKIADRKGRKGYYQATAATIEDQLADQETSISASTFQSLLCRVWFCETGLEDPMKLRQIAIKKRRA